LLFIHSATNDFTSGEAAYRTGQNYAIKQVQFLAVGILAMLMIATFDYRRVMSGWLFFFLGALGLLIACVLIGREINGAKSWIVVGGFGFQVAEYAKILYILTLASFYRDRRELTGLRALVIPGVVTL